MCPRFRKKTELVQVKTIVQPTNVEIVDIDTSEMKPSSCLLCHVPDEGSAVEVNLEKTHPWRVSSLIRSTEKQLWAL